MTGEARDSNARDMQAALEAIAAHARDEEARLASDAEALAREGYADLAAGTLSPGEREALERRADDDPEVARRLATFAPLSEAARASMADAVLGQMQATADRNAGGAREDGEQRRARETSPGDELALRRARKRSRALWMGGPLVAAAAAALLLFGDLGDSGRGPGSSLPSYELEVVGGVSETRGTPGERPANEPVRLGADATLQVLLRPATRLQGQALAAAVYARAGQRTEPVKAEVEIGASGAVRITTSGAHVFAAVADPTHLVFVVHEAESQPPRPPRESLKGDGRDAGPGWQRLVLPVAPHTAP